MHRTERRISHQGHYSIQSTNPARYRPNGKNAVMPPHPFFEIAFGCQNQPLPKAVASVRISHYVVHGEPFRSKVRKSFFRSFTNGHFFSIASGSSFYGPLRAGAHFQDFRGESGFAPVIGQNKRAEILRRDWLQRCRWFGEAGGFANPPIPNFIKSGKRKSLFA